MKLISLKLLNYRKFRQEEIIFKDDFTLVFGKNGAGKSSILDAIGYALFGPKSNDFVRVNKQFLKSYFVTSKEPSKIELTFQYLFDTYRIVRIIDAGTKKFASNFISETKDSLFGKNNLEIIGGDEITKFISNLLGINKDTFLKSVFAKQKDLEVLSGGPPERKSLINGVLGLNKIENIILEFKTEKKEKETNLKIYKKRVSDFDEEMLKEKKELLQKELKTTGKNLKIEEKFLKILDKTFTQTKEKFLREDKKRQDFLKIGNNISSNNKIYENLELETKNLKKQIEELYNKKNYLERNKEIIKKEEKLSKELDNQKKLQNDFLELQKLQKYAQKLFKELEIVNRLLRDFGKINLEKELKIAKGNLDKLKKEDEEITKNYLSVKSKINFLRDEYKNLKKEFDEIKKLDNKGKCPTCKRLLKDHFPYLVKDYEKKLQRKILEGKEFSKKEEDLKISLNKVKGNEKKQEKLIEDFLLKEKEFIKYSQDKKNLEKNILENDENIKKFGEIKFDEKEFEEIKENYETAKKEYLEYIKIKGEVRNLDNLEKSKKETQEKKNYLKKETEKLKEDLKKLEFNENEYEKLNEKYFSLNEKIKSKYDDIGKLKNEKSKKEFELKTILKQENDYKDDKKNVKETITQIDNLGLKETIMKDYIKYLLTYLKPKIEDLASSYFSIITDNKYMQILLDENYNIMVDGKNIELYSGGEKDLANLCLRLSLGQNLTTSKGNNINFLILDEILASQDRKRQENILVNLKKLENKFSQIILVSHLDEIKDLATNLIEIKSINNEESKICYF